MRIIENTYKLGQKVGIKNHDFAHRIDAGWVVGIDLDDNCRDITYSISDGYDETRRKHYWVYDGIKEIDLYPEWFINS